MPPTPFVNDPQPPFFLNSLWHFYYLWNNDYPTGNGTAWRHAVSSDLEHWRDAGIAIQKYTTPNGDPWSGCAIVDTHNTAGFGAGAVIALCTMPLPPGGIGQSTERWVSTDGGYRFAFDRVVMAHPASTAPGTAFRDPRVVWMEQTRSWVMVLAEQNKIGFYTSSDLGTWTYVSGFECNWLGVLECPALFPMNAYDADHTLLGTRWVLACGANGCFGGFTTGTHYWTGVFDGTTFTADTILGQWLDGGSDFYATAFFSHQTINSRPQDSYRAIAWKNNWDYATTVTQAGYYGAYSSVRSLALKTSNGQLRLTNTVLWKGAPYSFARLFGKQNYTRLLTPFSPQPLTPISGGSYLFFAAFSVGHAAWPSQIIINLQSGQGTPIQLILSPQAGYVTLLRQTPLCLLDVVGVWAAPRNAPLIFDRRMTVFAIVTPDSVEVIFNDGAVSRVVV